MKQNYIKEKWKTFIDKYKKYFISNEEKWNNNLENVINYIDMYQEKPTRKNNELLYNWINMQKLNYKNNKYLMKYTQIKEKWEIFTKKYKKYFD